MLTLGIAVISYVKKFFPDEVSVQERHDGPSPELARKTVMAQLAAAGKDTGIARRSLIIRSAGAAAGIVRPRPRRRRDRPARAQPVEGRPTRPRCGPPAGRRTYPGEVVYLRADTGDPHEVRLIRPEDQGAGSMQTVFPFRESERDDADALSAALKRADNPDDAHPAAPRHAGDPARRARRTSTTATSSPTRRSAPTWAARHPVRAADQRILCPCHQSQFIATEYAKPVFGPATRPLPQLPITVNDEGYLIATGDFTSPVGPAFWELGVNA